MPTTGREPAGRESRQSQMRRASATACSVVIRTLARLCSFEAETGMTSSAAPAA
jgi:hypothetical protein